MRTSTVVTGLVGGVALAAVLIAPLYVALPARYLVNWHFMTPQGGLAGMTAALVVWVGVGFGAAWLNPEEPVRSGTASALIASIVGSVLMVLPAAAVEACSELIITQGVGRAGAEKVKALTAAALIEVVWLPAAAGFAMLIAGPALGAVGGVSFDLWRGIPGRKRDLHYSPVPVAALFAGLVWGGGTLWALGQADGAVLPALNHKTTYVGLLELTAPIGLLGLCTSVAVSWALRDAVVLFRARRRVMALGWGVIALGVPPLMLIEMGVLYPRAFLSVLTWAGIGLCCVLALVAVVNAARSDDALDPVPRTFGQVVSDALLVGIAVVGQGALVGGSSFIAAWLIVQPYLDALLGEDALVRETPEWLVATIFRLHWAAGASMLLVALLWLGAALPVWLAVRALAGRRG